MFIWTGSAHRIGFGRVGEGTAALKVLDISHDKLYTYGSQGIDPRTRGDPGSNEPNAVIQFQPTPLFLLRLPPVPSVSPELPPVRLAHRGLYFPIGEGVTEVSWLKKTEY